MKTLLILILLTFPASAKTWINNDPSETGVIAIFSEGDGYRLETNEHVFHCKVDGDELACDRASPRKKIEFLADGKIRLDGETFSVQDE
jgi:hypothetical protein